MKYEGKLKRAFDVAVGAVCLTALTATGIIPLLAFASAAYHRENPFFVEERVGKDGKNFNIYKIKSMYTLYDAKGELLDDDQRRSMLGSILKYTSLDELPQLVNVIKGDMSLVGPRPLAQEEMDEVPDKYKKDILKVRPGMTGPWQVSAIGRKTTFGERVIRDAHYVRNGITLTQDLYYMFRTIPALIYGHDR